MLLLRRSCIQSHARHAYTPLAGPATRSLAVTALPRDCIVLGRDAPGRRRLLHAAALPRSLLSSSSLRLSPPSKHSSAVGVVCAQRFSLLALSCCVRAVSSTSSSPPSLRSSPSPPTSSSASSSSSSSSSASTPPVVDLLDAAQKRRSRNAKLFWLAVAGALVALYALKQLITTSRSSSSSSSSNVASLGTSSGASDGTAGDNVPLEESYERLLVQLARACGYDNGVVDVSKPPTRPLPAEMAAQRLNALQNLYALSKLNLRERRRVAVDAGGTLLRLLTLLITGRPALRRASSTTNEQQPDALLAPTVSADAVSAAPFSPELLYAQLLLSILARQPSNVPRIVHGGLLPALTVHREVPSLAAALLTLYGVADPHLSETFHEELLRQPGVEQLLRDALFHYEPLIGSAAALTLDRLGLAVLGPSEKSMYEHVLMAFDYTSLAKREDMMEHAQAATKDAPQLAWAWYASAYWFYAFQYYEAARRNVLAALRIDTGCVGALWVLAQLAIREGRPDAARLLILRLMQERPDYPPLVEFLAQGTAHGNHTSAADALNIAIANASAAVAAVSATSASAPSSTAASAPAPVAAKS